MNSSHETLDTSAERTAADALISAEEVCRHGLCAPEDLAEPLLACRRSLFTGMTCKSMDVTQRLAFYEGQLSRLAAEALKTVGGLYLVFLDLVSWLDELGRRRDGEERNATLLLGNVVSTVFESRFASLDQIQREEGTAALCDHRLKTRLLYKFFHSKWAKLYHSGFSTVAFNEAFVQYMTDRKRMSRHPKDTWRWILEMKWVDKLAPEQVAELCMLNNTIPNMIDYFRSNPNLEFVQKVTSFLDRAAGRTQGSFIQEKELISMSVDEIDSADRLAVRHNTITGVVFKLVRDFHLPPHLQRWSVFLRKLHSMFATVREFRGRPDAHYDHAFPVYEQKMRHLMRDDPAMQFAGLKYVWPKSNNEAFYFAAYLDIPRGCMPQAMYYAYDTDIWEKAKRAVDVEKLSIAREAEALLNGFQLKEPLPHRVFVLDSVEKLNWLYDSIGKNEDVGFDAEWDQSYCGEMGILCLLQVSFSEETYLIDIHHFRENLKVDNDFWTHLFSRIFHANKTVYGFAVDSDFKTIVHNFPHLEEVFASAECKSVVCLRSVVGKVANTVKACQEVFQGVAPEKQNLQAMTERILGWRMLKDEQSSVWSERPLRFKQQKNIDLDLDTIMAPFQFSGVIEKARKVEESRDARRASEVLMMITQNNPGRKTKSAHFSRPELVKLVEAINLDMHKRFPEEKFRDHTQLRYVADPMCSQIGALLRRCGVSVATSQTTAENVEKCLFDPELKVLTTGKAIKQFTIDPCRIVDLPASVATLDHQLVQFVEKERVYVDPERMRPRCCRCNSGQLCMLPTRVVKYLHCVFGLVNAQKMGTPEYETGDVLKLKMELQKSGTNESRPGMYGSYASSEKHELYLTPYARIDLKKLTICRLHAFRSVPESRPVPLSLASHVNYRDVQFPAGTLHAICPSCGKENNEAIDLPIRT